MVKHMESFTANTFAVYAEFDWRLHPLVVLQTGLRASAFNYGPLRQGGIEPRFSASFSAIENTTAYVSWTRMNQYVHRLAAGAAVVPADVWLPTVEGVPASTGYQTAVGLTHRFPVGNLQVTAEAFDKRLIGLVTYRPGAPDPVPPVDWPAVLFSGQGHAQGVEFLIQKDSGALTGWVSYTLARSTRTFAGIANGEPIPDVYDRRHDLTFTATHQFSERLQVSATWVYGTSYPATLPIGLYQAPNRFGSRGG